MIVLYFIFKIISLKLIKTVVNNNKAINLLKFYHFVICTINLIHISLTNVKSVDLSGI